jgi:hypothetical protein
MKIGKISEVTKIYHSSKGNDYCLVSVELLEIGEDQKDFWNPVMYGTINWKFIDNNGKLNRMKTMFHSAKTTDFIRSNSIHFLKQFTSAPVWLSEDTG